MLREAIEFYGHPNVRSTHQKTIEITKHEHLTKRGDCIVGVRASKACSDLSDEVKSVLRNKGSLVRFEIEINNEKFEFFGRGSPELTFADEHEIVIRKSNFVSSRTLAVNCDKASSDIPRNMVGLLKKKETHGLLRIYIQE